MCFSLFQKKAQYPSHIGRERGQQDIDNVHSQHKITSASAQSRAHYMSLFWVGWTVWKKKRKTNPFNISSIWLLRVTKHTIKQRGFFIIFFYFLSNIQIDYHDTFNHIVNSTIIRVVFCNAFRHGWLICQPDIDNVFFTWVTSCKDIRVLTIRIWGC